MSESDDEYARAWKKAVDRDRPRQRRNLIANVIGMAAALVVLAVFSVAAMWLAGQNLGRRRSPEIYVFGFGFVLAVGVFGGVRAALGAREY